MPIAWSNPAAVQRVARDRVGVSRALALAAACFDFEIDGQCMQKTCKQSSQIVPEAPFDCASYAAACVHAGEHWSGTKEVGACTRVL